MEMEIMDPTAIRQVAAVVIDLVAPLGKGQRCLDHRAAARRQDDHDAEHRQVDGSANHPECYLIVLLIDERPEEVTDMAAYRRRAKSSASTFDEPATRHVQVAEMVIEKAKSALSNTSATSSSFLTTSPVSRAPYNTVIPSSGKVLTGGVDANALQRPEALLRRGAQYRGRRLADHHFATALIDTGSRMDEVIFEEFKGTGNSEIILDRKLTDKRTWPSIDITRSGTRKEELLVDKGTLSKMWVLRRILTPMGVVDSMEFLLKKLKETKNNAEFFDAMNT